MISSIKGKSNNIKINFYFNFLPLIFILFSLLFYILNIQNLFTCIISLITTCFIPGFLILRTFSLKLLLHEFIPCCIIFSIIILMVISFYLSITPFHISPMSVLTSILIIIIIQIIFISNKEIYLKDLRKQIIENKYYLILIILVTLIPVLLIDDILRYEYFLGYDPFTNKPNMLLILQNKLDPTSFLMQRGIVFSGFYYFGSILHVLTGITFYEFTRYGSIIFLSISLLMMSSITYKIFNDKWAYIVPFFYMINPFVVNRFVMTIRENFSFLYLMLYIFFIIKFNENVEKKELIFLSSIIFGAILSTHPLTAVFSAMLFISFIKKNSIKNLFIIFTLGTIIIIAPFLSIFVNWFFWVVKAQILIFMGYSNIPIPYWLTEAQVLSIWNRDIFIRDFSILEISLLPLGIFHIMRNKLISREKPLFFIVILCIPTLLLYLLSKVGFHFTPSRLIIYAAFPLAIFSAIGLRELVNKLCGYIPVITVIINKRVLERNRIHQVLISLIIIPVILLNSINIINLNKWCPYQSSQVDGAIWLEQKVRDEYDVLVIPSVNDITLIEYAGIKNSLSHKNLKFINELIQVNSYEDLIRIVHTNYSDVQNFYFFFSQKWGHYALLEVLIKKIDPIYQNDGALIFKIQILN